MIINGKEEHIATPITVAELIEQRGLRAERVAVELNGEIVPRALRAQTQLKGTDTLEIVTFVRLGQSHRRTGTAANVPQKPPVHGRYWLATNVRPGGETEAACTRRTRYMPGRARPHPITRKRTETRHDHDL